MKKKDIYRVVLSSVLAANCVPLSTLAMTDYNNFSKDCFNAEQPAEPEKPAELPDVIPVKDGVQKPDGYVVVKFVLNRNDSPRVHGKFNDTNEFYVRPNVKVNIPAPSITANRGYRFTIYEFQDTREEYVGEYTFTKDTRILALFSKKHIDPQEEPDLSTKVIPATENTVKPAGWFTVEFTKGEGVDGFIGTSKFYVAPNEPVEIEQPKTKPAYGYAERIAEKINMTVTKDATIKVDSKKLTIPQTGDGTQSVPRLRLMGLNINDNLSENPDTPSPKQDKPKEIRLSVNDTKMGKVYQDTIKVNYSNVNNGKSIQCLAAAYPGFYIKKILADGKEVYNNDKRYFEKITDKEVIDNNENKLEYFTRIDNFSRIPDNVTINKEDGNIKYIDIKVEFAPLRVMTTTSEEFKSGPGHRYITSEEYKEIFKKTPKENGINLKLNEKKVVFEGIEDVSHITHHQVCEVSNLEKGLDNATYTPVDDPDNGSVGIGPAPWVGNKDKLTLVGGPAESDIHKRIDGPITYVYVRNDEVKAGEKKTLEEGANFVISETKYIFNKEKGEYEVDEENSFGKGLAKIGKIEVGTKPESITKAIPRNTLPEKDGFKVVSGKDGEKRIDTTYDLNEETGELTSKKTETVVSEPVDDRYEEVAPQPPTEEKTYNVTIKYIDDVTGETVKEETLKYPEGKFKYKIADEQTIPDGYKRAPQIGSHGYDDSNKLTEDSIIEMRIIKHSKLTINYVDTKGNKVEPSYTRDCYGRARIYFVKVGDPIDGTGVGMTSNKEMWVFGDSSQSDMSLDEEFTAFKNHQPPQDAKLTWANEDNEINIVVKNAEESKPDENPDAPVTPSDDDKPVTPGDNDKPVTPGDNQKPDDNKDPKKPTQDDNKKPSPDASKSELILNVKDNVEIEKGDELDLTSLIEKATDKDGTDIKNKVKIDKGNFDATKSGKYTVKYTLTSKNGETIEKDITITVKDVEITPYNNTTPKTNTISKVYYYLAAAVLAALVSIGIIKKKDKDK